MGQLHRHLSLRIRLIRFLPFAFEVLRLLPRLRFGKSRRRFGVRGRLTPLNVSELPTINHLTHLALEKVNKRIELARHRITRALNEPQSAIFCRRSASSCALCVCLSRRSPRPALKTREESTERFLTRVLYKRNENKEWASEQKKR